MEKCYKKEYASNISFPLGGIGTGTIGLSGEGRLIDWEINNRPNRVSINPFTNFAIKAEDENKVIDYRILQGDINDDYMGIKYENRFSGYGHGLSRETMAGVRHFKDVCFYANFPIAKIGYNDPIFPGEITLEAFNPFIPSNDKDSSIPAAFFDYKITNTTSKALNYTIAFSVTNPLNSPGKHFKEIDENLKSIIMESKERKKELPDYANFCISTDCEDVSYQVHWYRGGWFDNITMFLNDFSTYGKFKNREYDTIRQDSKDTSVLAAHIKIKANESKHVRFHLSWFVPNVWKYWQQDSTPKTDWKNSYAKIYSHAKDVRDDCFKRWQYLYENTLAFQKALSSSSLPDVIKDAIMGNIATLKSTTCLRLTNGEFYAWEGVNKNTGSCEGTCQHVWNYAYALPFLFPKLERSAREIELKYSLEKSGKLHFRVMLPLGSKMSEFRACVDGQMGTVMKFYREWKISGDMNWLKDHWDKIKSCIEYAWSKENDDKWDINKKGVMFGRQHHTLDVELFGANSWLTGFYHGALLAGAEMAVAMKENNLAKEYLDLFKKGQKWLDENTFNGNYYIQKIDLKDKKIVDQFNDEKSINMENGYWDDENGEIKYQIATGCEIDQVTANWHSDLMGLPNIFIFEHRKKALETLYKRNFMSMREVDNACRIFALNDEKGLLICTFNENEAKPKIPIPYAQEVMTGFEYTVAANMLQCGMEKEAINIVKAIRNRYDGKKRNPYSEIECGASYSRAMSSYSFLLIYSGFKYDMTKRCIGFIPKKLGNYFWSIEGAWGYVSLEKDNISFNVLYGSLALRRFIHYFTEINSVKLNGKNIDYIENEEMIEFDIKICRDHKLTIN